MALQKFTDDMHIIAKLDDEPNDVGGLTADELKAKFDEGGVALQRYINETMLPQLETMGVEQAVLLPENAGGFKYMRLNSDKVLEVSTDGKTWQATGSSGHLIFDKYGKQMPQRSRIKFADSEVTDDGTYTIVQGEAVKFSEAQSLTSAQQQQARDNIGAPAPYEAGDNIAITGRIITTKAFPCNPNLLDNWYFGNPVDQRKGVIPKNTSVKVYYDVECTNYAGPVNYYPSLIRESNGNFRYDISDTSHYYIKAEDTMRGYSAARYTIDRWYANFNAVVSVVDGAVKLNSSSGKSFFYQIIAEGKSIAGRMCTYSMLLSNNELLTGSVVAPADIGTAVAVEKGGVALYFEHSANYPMIAVVEVPENANLSVVAVKPELGSQQTLAHKEYGEWVLNEIPKFGDQLAECQRYYYQAHYVQYQTINMSYEDTAYSFIMLPLPVTMRIDTPVLTQSKPIALGTSEKILTSAEVKGCMAKLSVNYTAISNAQKGAYSYCADPDGVTFTLSADL